VTAPPLVTQAAQGPAPCPRLYRPERYYVGRRLDETEIYTVSRAELKPLAHLHYQSDAAFEWGFSTAGSLELAFAMLAHTTESRPTDLVCRMFCAEVVACLDRAGFVRSSSEIVAWLITVFSDAEISPTSRAVTVTQAWAGAQSAGSAARLRRT
jgi:hypothetical protein